MARLVLLHAFPLDSRMWDEQQIAFPGQIDAPDLYARGESLEDWAKDVLDTVHGDPLIVVGCSMGRDAPLALAAVRKLRHRSRDLGGIRIGGSQDPLSDLTRNTPHTNG